MSDRMVDRLMTDKLKQRNSQQLRILASSACVKQRATIAQFFRKVVQVLVNEHVEGRGLLLRLSLRSKT
jgi:hypothetical protein